MRRQVEALRADGFPGELVERDELPAALRRGFHNACLTDHDGALHPARWIRALAGAAEGAGARIHERTAVARPGPRPAARSSPAAGRVRGAPRGRGRRRRAGRPGAGYAGRVRARRLHMVATEPLPERLVDWPVYARCGYEYFQQRPTGALLAGGFADLDGERLLHRPRRGQPGGLGAHRALPAPRTSASRRRVTHRWVGMVGYSDDGLPWSGRSRAAGLYVAGGYSGTATCSATSPGAAGRPDRGREASRCSRDR